MHRNATLGSAWRKGAGDPSGPTPLAAVRQKARKVLALVLTTAVAVSLGLATPPAAMADTAPLDAGNPATPVTVSADGLPTAQINGVAWTQVIIGNTVYVGGNFTQARPAGAAPGTGVVTRNNILAYNLTTGELLSAFAPSFNAEVTALAASPDGSRLYVGGSFTTYNGATVWRAVALNPTDGSIVLSFLPRMSASVRAIVATDTTVYMGGLFNAVGSVARGELAAVSAADASLLPWNPTAAGGRVNALALSPDGASMVVGGAFTSLNGLAKNGYGLGKVDTAQGAALPFPVNTIVKNGGSSGSITSLASDGTSVFGSGYTYGRSSTLEGVFSVKWSDSSLNWIEDCHGDTYSLMPIGDAVYTAGHAHYCGNIDGFPQTSPWEFNRGIAFSKKATGVVTAESHNYTNYAGNPAPSLLNWYPIINDGTFTGQSQGPWTLTGNDDYLAMAGEFTTINNQPQQGLTRFPRTGLSPNKRGPRVTGRNFNPTLSTPAAGTIRVRWQANWDQDNENLTYEVRRNGAVISTINHAAPFWRRPGMTFVDTNLTPGKSYGYRIFARDAFGNEARSDTVSVTAAGSGAAPGAYTQQVLADKPNNYWRLGEAGGATGVDLAGKDDLTILPGVSFAAGGAINADADTAATFNGSTTGVAGSPTLSKRSNTFTAEAWVKTGSTAGGQIVGYGNSQTGVSTDSDRIVYMDNTGRIFFGVRPTGSSSPATRVTVNTSGTYNDNQWHHVVATLSPAGMQLFVDGTLATSKADTTAAWAIDGYWRIGGDNLNGWPSRPSSRYLAGQLDDVAIYPVALPLPRVQAHYTASGRSLNAPPSPPVAAFTHSVNGLTVSVDGATSSDANGPITAYAWDFGNGKTGTGVTADHVYTAAGTYTVKLTVTDNSGSTNSIQRPVTVTAPPANATPTAAFTSAPSNLTVAFDGSGSSDSDGTIASHAWTFGDGTSGAGAKPSHTYAGAGTFRVTLTVTDNAGATGSTSRDVTVTAPPAGAAFAADAFGRTVSGGFGTADTGGAWTVGGGASNFAVGSGVGAITLGTAGASRTGYLNSVSSTGFDGRVKVSADKIASGGGMYLSLVGRRLNSNDYRAKLKVAANGVVSLYLTKVINDAQTTLAGPLTIPGLTLAANDALTIRLQLQGTSPTSISAKVWRASAAEPAAWHLTASDSTAQLQAAGSPGLIGYLSGSAANAPVVLRIDDFAVKQP